jgi:hypothetical protein
MAQNLTQGINVFSDGDGIVGTMNPTDILTQGINKGSNQTGFFLWATCAVEVWFYYNSGEWDMYTSFEENDIRFNDQSAHLETGHPLLGSQISWTNHELLGEVAGAYFRVNYSDKEVRVIEITKDVILGDYVPSDNITNDNFIKWEGDNEEDDDDNLKNHNAYRKIKHSNFVIGEEFSFTVDKRIDDAQTFANKVFKIDTNFEHDTVNDITTITFTVPSSYQHGNETISIDTNTPIHTWVSLHEIQAAAQTSNSGYTIEPTTPTHRDSNIVGPWGNFQGLTITAMKNDGNGNIYIAGDFFKYGEDNVNKLIKINATTLELDQTFDWSYVFGSPNSSEGKVIGADQWNIQAPPDDMHFLSNGKMVIVYNYRKRFRKNETYDSLGLSDSDKQSLILSETHSFFVIDANTGEIDSTLNGWNLPSEGVLDNVGSPWARSYAVKPFQFIFQHIDSNENLYLSWQNGIYKFTTSGDITEHVGWYDDDTGYPGEPKQIPSFNFFIRNHYGLTGPDRRRDLVVTDSQGLTYDFSQRIVSSRKWYDMGSLAPGGIHDWTTSNNILMNSWTSIKVYDLNGNPLNPLTRNFKGEMVSTNYPLSVKIDSQDRIWLLLQQNSGYRANFWNDVDFSNASTQWNTWGTLYWDENFQGPSDLAHENGVSENTPFSQLLLCLDLNGDVLGQWRHNFHDGYASTPIAILNINETLGLVTISNGSYESGDNALPLNPELLNWSTVRYIDFNTLSELDTFYDVTRNRNQEKQFKFIGRPSGTQSTVKDLTIGFNALAEVDSDKFLVGGYFNEYDGEETNLMVGLKKSDSSRWTPYVKENIGDTGVRRFSPKDTGDLSFSTGFSNNILHSIYYSPFDEPSLDMRSIKWDSPFTVNFWFKMGAVPKTQYGNGQFVELLSLIGNNAIEHSYDQNFNKYNMEFSLKYSTTSGLSRLEYVIATSPSSFYFNHWDIKDGLPNHFKWAETGQSFVDPYVAAGFPYSNPAAEHKWSTWDSLNSPGNEKGYVMITFVYHGDVSTCNADLYFNGNWMGYSQKYDGKDHSGNNLGYGANPNIFNSGTWPTNQSIDDYAWDVNVPRGLSVLGRGWGTPHNNEANNTFLTGAGYQEPYGNSQMDDLSFWGKALNQGEINNLWNNGNGNSISKTTQPSDLITYYDFDESRLVNNYITPVWPNTGNGKMYINGRSRLVTGNY